MWGVGDDAWVAVEGRHRAQVHVADSWLIEDGAVRGWSLHVERFTKEAHAAAGDAMPWDRVMRDALALVPCDRTRTWFPRIDLQMEPEGWRCDFTLRVNPPVPRTAIVAVVEDKRIAPRIKGPDIQHLSLLQDEVGKLGASHALLRSADGTVVDCAIASVVWWRDGILHLVDPALDCLPGVTRNLLAQKAAQMRTRVYASAARTEELQECETWLVNSRAGIVPVTEWIGWGAAASLDRERLEDWQVHLRGLRQPLAVLRESARLCK